MSPPISTFFTIAMMATAYFNLAHLAITILAASTPYLSLDPGPKSRTRELLASFASTTITLIQNKYAYLPLSTLDTDQSPGTARAKTDTPALRSIAAGKAEHDTDTIGIEIEIDIDMAQKSATPLTPTAQAHSSPSSSTSAKIPRTRRTRTRAAHARVPMLQVPTGGYNCAVM